MMRPDVVGPDFFPRISYICATFVPHLCIVRALSSDKRPAAYYTTTASFLLSCLADRHNTAETARPSSGLPRSFDHSSAVFYVRHTSLAIASFR